MSTSFGKWYEEKKNDDSETGESSGTNGSNNTWGSVFGGTIPNNFDEMTASMDQYLPTLSTEGLMNNVDLQKFTVANMISSMEQTLPKKICGMNYQQRLQVFGVLLCISILFFTLAFFIGIPMITVRPQKFALSFTCGSLLFMSSFAIMKGPIDHFNSLFHKDRIVFTIIYLSSMLTTIYCTFSFSGISGYILVISSSAIQLITLLWYLISFLPGGTTGLKYLIAVMCQLFKPLFIICAKWQAYCMTKCITFFLRR